MSITFLRNDVQIKRKQHNIAKYTITFCSQCWHCSRFYLLLLCYACWSAALYTYALTQMRGCASNHTFASMLCYVVLSCAVHQSMRRKLISLVACAGEWVQLAANTTWPLQQMWQLCVRVANMYVLKLLFVLRATHASSALHASLFFNKFCLFSGLLYWVSVSVVKSVEFVIALEWVQVQWQVGGCSEGESCWWIMERKRVFQLKEFSWAVSEFIVRSHNLVYIQKVFGSFRYLTI